jgi:uncharacterized protein (TIGR00255 family)
MTGHGRGEGVRGDYKITVELASVNRKQLELSINLPRELDVLEAQARELLNGSVARGRVNARVALASGGGTARVQVNHALAKGYQRDFSKLAKDLKLDGAVSLETVLRAPGVLETSDVFAEPKSFWQTVEKAFKAAIKELTAMRVREGGSMLKDLQTRIDAMRKAKKRVEKLAPKVVERYRKNLSARIENAGLTVAEEDRDRLLKEIVIFSDRSDISEELARLASHFDQFDHYVKSKKPVGRTLDFLAQEMNREINTIGSKANDAAIAAEVVALKTELEKFREQVQNIE